MRRILLFSILTLTFILAMADPLAEMIWMVGSKNDYLYIYGGSFLGIEYVKAFEVPTLPADVLLPFTGCDVDLLKAMIRNESNFRVHATSPTGALGVSQMVRSTAKWLGLRNPYNPLSSAFAMCKYIKMLSKDFKSTEEILWAYHDGPGAIKKRGPSKDAKVYASTVMKFYRQYESGGKLEWFKDRVLLKTSLKVYPMSNYEFKLGGAFSFLGFLDFDGGIKYTGEGFGYYLATYLRVFHDLALVVDYEDGEFYFGTSFWYLTSGLEVLMRPGGGYAKLIIGNFGFSLENGRIAAFYRMGL